MKQHYKRVRTPTILQMESLECGAAALGIVLAYYHCYVPLEKLRIDCGVSRDGSKANNILKAARCYGLTARGYRVELQDLHDLPLPMILFWKFNHFLVLEGFGRNHVYLNDPASGPCKVTYEEFDEAFTGIALTFEPGPDFKKSGVKQRLLPVLRTFLSGSEGSLVYVILAGIGILITGLVIPAFSRIFVDHILVRGQNWLIPLLLGMGLTLALRTILTWVQQSVLAKLETKLSIASSSRFIWHTLRLPVEFFNQRYAGEIKSRAGLNDKVARLMSGQLATTLLNLMLVIFYLFVMFQYDVLLTLISFGVALLNLVALLLISRHRTDANQRLLQERGKLMGTTYNGILLIETYKAAGTESDLFARWGGYQAKALNTEQQLTLSDQVLSGLPAFLSIFSMAAVLTVGSLRVMAGEITIGMLVAFQSLLTSFLAPINQFIALGATFQEVRGDLTRLDDVLRYELDPVLSTQTGLPKDEEKARLFGSLDLRGIEFGYNRLEAPLIEDFNLTLKPGSRVALVGASGSGKSTVAQLIAGLYAPWSGEILFDGKSRERWPREIITNSLAMVSQDILLFEGTVRENLTLWDETVTEQSILKAAKDAAIHGEITARAGGYESPVEEDGHNFSGGQRQRLEIARALVMNPAIVILDEATSALDPITEQQIDSNLRRRGCTCLIVAHRLSTIRDCDEIIVMERGKIVQRGAHDELIASEGPYARLLATEEYETQKTKLESLLETL